jgi:hypothetical protein
MGKYRRGKRKGEKKLGKYKRGGKFQKRELISTPQHWVINIVSLSKE